MEVRPKLHCTFHRLQALIARDQKYAVTVHGIIMWSKIASKKQKTVENYSRRPEFSELTFVVFGLNIWYSRLPLCRGSAQWTCYEIIGSFMWEHIGFYAVFPPKIINPLFRHFLAHPSENKGEEQGNFPLIEGFISIIIIILRRRRENFGGLPPKKSGPHWESTVSM